uniref:Telomerase reverse transcriptase n=1 Tax=Sphaeramia orbicularis TaxID=375764 RepID=A0A672YP67_9TELE
MSTTDLSRVLDILRVIYRHVQTLEEFADSIVFREGQRAVPVEQGDTNRFKTFVRGVFVCADKELQQVPSCNQICTLPELLAFVLNSLKRKRKRNVLVHGYNFLTVAQEERDADHFKFQGDITQSAAYIHGSDLWKKVTKRLGTDITRYLFESCSVFVAVPPSCVFQVCGNPVYDRVSVTTPTSGISLQPRLKTHISHQTRHHGGVVSLKRRWGASNPSNSKKRWRKDDGEKIQRKRKREIEDDESIKSAKRRAAEQPELTLDNHKACYETAVEQTMSVEPTPFVKSVENNCTASRNYTEKQTTTVPVEGGPSWRSGIFPPLPPSQCFFRTLGILYGGRGMRGFLLNRKKKSLQGSKQLQGKDLIRVIFFEGQAYLSGVERKPKKLPRRFFNMVPVFNQLLNRHRRFPYVRILQRLCPDLEDKDAGEAELTSLVCQHCAPHRVYLFIRQCLIAVIPQELWGSDHNRVHFCSKVRGFLCSGKYERLSLAELMWKIKVNDCDWLKIRKTGRFPPSELAYRTQVLGQFLAWLLDGYVVGLVRACFYVTESVGQKNDMAFRYKHIYSRLHESSEPIPKPGLFGAPFLLFSLAPSQKEKPQPLYFVKVDVSGAYESLPHDKLMEVIGEALAPVLEEPFTIRRYAKVWADSYEGLKKTFVRQADLLEDNMGSTSMKGFVMSLQKKGKIHHTILVEQHFCSDLHGREALEFFTQMLTGSVVQFGKKTYRQCRGIPQGSVVSSLLCCLCYGHMENVLFKDITENKVCLMRLVDDFLLITPDLHEAQTFLKMLLAGVPEYGLVVNPQKVVVNFQVSGRVGSYPDFRVLPPHCLFPWCGLLIDTHSLDVYKDYSSYAGLSLRYSLTLGSFHSAGQQMRRKLLAILRLKCHALFLDLKTNSVEAVYQNIYKLVLLHACRFHVCAQSLPFGQTVAKNPVYFLRMILDMAEYTNHLIRRSNKGLILGTKAQTGIIQYEAVELLFCLSFLLVLSQHRRFYKDLIPHLHQRKRSLERRLGDLRLARVRQATSPRTPVDFFAIQT